MSINREALEAIVEGFINEMRFPDEKLNTAERDGLAARMKHIRGHADNKSYAADLLQHWGKKASEATNAVYGAEDDLFDNKFSKKPTSRPELSSNPEYNTEPSIRLTKLNQAAKHMRLASESQKRLAQKISK